MLPIACFAAHPLNSDDTSTQGAGKWQLELNNDNSSQTIGGTRISINMANATLTYGLHDRLDIAANLPYQHISDNVGSRTKHGDAALVLKWRLYEQAGFSLALKPQITLPTGDETQGFGNGRATYGINTLAGYDAKGGSLLGNVGYTYNDNRIGSRKDLWNISAAVLIDVADKTRLAFDFGSSRNTDPGHRQNPVFSIVGIVYYPNDRVDLDMGFKKGLNRAEVDYSWGLGWTFRW